MLRESSQSHEQSVDLKVIMQGGDANDIEHSEALTKFAESIVTRNSEDIAKARDSLRQVAGDEVMIDAAGVASNFERMVRIADSTGIVLGDFEFDVESMQQSLGIDQFK